MMSLNQLKTAILEAADGYRITPTNYAEIADRVMPHYPRGPRKSRAGQVWEIVREADRFVTSDWLDMAIFRAALNQAYASP